MSRTYFGTDGIRGTVGMAPITPDFMLRLGHAVGQVLRQGERRPTVLHRQGHAHLRLHDRVGARGRLRLGRRRRRPDRPAADARRRLPDAGASPRPRRRHQRLAQPVRRQRHQVLLGARREASRTPGRPRSKRRSPREQQWVGSAELGRARRLDDASGRYIEFCKSTYSNDLTLRGLSIVVDAAHGAAYHVAPDVFHELGAEVTSIGCRPDGFNINAGFGATAPQALVDAVVAGGADYGIALDGDGDRLQVVDGAGRLYNGDELLYVLAAARLDQGRPVPGVVGTLMTNLGVEQALRGRGVDVVRTAVGDRYVLEELLQRGWQLGGEGSGHLLVLDRHTTGDGIVSALMVLEAVVRSGRRLRRPARRRRPLPADADQRPPEARRRLDGEPRARRSPRRGRPRARRERAGADPAFGNRAGGPCHGRGARRCAVEALRRAAGGDSGLRRSRDDAAFALSSCDARHVTGG